MMEFLAFDENPTSPASSASSASFFLGKNATIVFPTITHGNVGQLACDLLIYNLKLRRLGTLHHDDVLPVCGSDPFSENDEVHPASSLEIYSNEDLSVVVVQQRGEVARGAQKKFANDVVQWVRESAFKRVIFLASLPSRVGEKDSQIGGTKWRTIHTPNVATENYPPFPGESSPIQVLELEQIPEDLKDRRIPPWTMVYECIKQSLTAHFLVALCSEGDNSVDADKMASHALEMIEQLAGANSLSTTDIVLPNGEMRWIAPPSWKRVYGNTIKRSVFA